MWAVNKLKDRGEIGWSSGVQVALTDKFLDFLPLRLNNLSQ